VDKRLKHHWLPDLSSPCVSEDERTRDVAIGEARHAINQKSTAWRSANLSKRTRGVHPQADVKGAFELFERAERSLRHICLDDVLSPCNPSTLEVNGQPMAQFDWSSPGAAYQTLKHFE
jgi:hypothetical protein